jgi:hypothetical protein
MAARQAAAAAATPLPPALVVAAGVVAAAAEAALRSARPDDVNVGGARAAHGVATGAAVEPAPLDLSVEERYLATDVAIVADASGGGGSGGGGAPPPPPLALLTLLSLTPLLFMEGLTLDAPPPPPAAAVASSAAAGATAPAQRALPLRLRVLRTTAGVRLDSASARAASDAMDVLDVGQAGFAAAARAVHLRDGEGDDRFRVLVVPTAWCDRCARDGTVLRVGFRGEFERAGVPFLRGVCDELAAAAGAAATQPVLLFRMDASRQLTGMWRVVSGIELDADLRRVRVHDYKQRGGGGGGSVSAMEYFAGKGPPLTEVVQPLVRVKPAHSFPMLAAGREEGSPMPAELFVAFDGVVPAMVYGQPLLVAAVRVALARGHAVTRAAWGLTTELRLGVHLPLGGSAASTAGPGAYAHSDVGVAPAAPSHGGTGRTPHRPAPGPLLLSCATASNDDDAASAAPFNVHPHVATTTRPGDGSGGGSTDYLLPAHLLAQVLTVGFGDGGGGRGGGGATLPGLLPTTLAQVGLDADDAVAVADAAAADEGAPFMPFGLGAIGRLAGSGGSCGGSSGAVRRIHLSRGLPRGHDRLARLGEAVLDASVSSNGVVVTHSQPLLLLQQGTGPPCDPALTNPNPALFPDLFHSTPPPLTQISCLLVPLRGSDRRGGALRPLTPAEASSLRESLAPEDAVAALLGAADWAALLLDEPFLAYVIRRGLTRAQYLPAAAAPATAAVSRGARLGQRREAVTTEALAPEQPPSTAPADTDPPPPLRRFPASDLRQVTHALLGAVFVACGWGAAKLVAARLLQTQLTAAVEAVLPGASPRVDSALLQERLFAAELCGSAVTVVPAATAAGGGDGSAAAAAGASLLRPALACAQAVAQAELGRRAPVWLVPPAPAEKPLAALLPPSAAPAVTAAAAASPDWRLASYRAHSHAVGSALLRLAVTARLFFTLPTLEAPELGYVCAQLLDAWHTVLHRLHRRLAGLDELQSLAAQPSGGGDGGGGGDANPVATVPQLLAAYYYAALGHKAATAGDAALARAAAPAAVHAHWPLRLPAVRIDGGGGGGSGGGGRTGLSPLAAAVARHRWSSAVVDALSYRLPASLLAAVECVFWSALRDPGPAAVLGLLQHVDAGGAAGAADAREVYQAPHVYPLADAASVASLSRCVAVCGHLRAALAPPAAPGVVLASAPGSLDELFARAGVVDAAPVLAQLRAVDARMVAMVSMGPHTPLQARLAAVGDAREAAEALVAARAHLHRPRSRDPDAAAAGTFDGLDAPYLAACRRAATAGAVEAVLRLHAAADGHDSSVSADEQVESAGRCAYRCVELLAPPLHDAPARAAVAALLLAEEADPRSSLAWPASYTGFTLAGLAVMMARHAAVMQHAAAMQRDKKSALYTKLARSWASVAVTQLCAGDGGGGGDGDALAALEGGVAGRSGGGVVELSCVGGGTVDMSHRERLAELAGLEAALAATVDVRALTMPVRLGHRGARLLLQMPLPKRRRQPAVVGAPPSHRRRPWLAPPLQRLLTFTDQRHRVSWDYVLLLEDAGECHAMEAALRQIESPDASPLVDVRWSDSRSKHVTVVVRTSRAGDVVVDAGCLFHAPSSAPRIVDASLRRVTATDSSSSGGAGGGGEDAYAVLCFGVEVLKPAAQHGHGADDDDEGGGGGGGRRGATRRAADVGHCVRRMRLRAALVVLAGGVPRRRRHPAAVRDAPAARDGAESVQPRAARGGRRRR